MSNVSYISNEMAEWWAESFCRKEMENGQDGEISSPFGYTDFLFVLL